MAETILQEADRIIHGERQELHGKMSESFPQIAHLWTGYLGHAVSPQDVAAMMILLKVVRLRASYKRDTWVDIAGYAGIGAVIDGMDEE